MVTAGAPEPLGALARWRADPVAFIREVLRDPETKAPFALYPAQERFLREGFTPGPDGRLPHSELVYACPKKSGKTATAAMGTLYTVVALGGPYAEGYCVANDLEQAQGRVFKSIERIVKASPLLRSAVKITTNAIEFLSTGATITALASDSPGPPEATRRSPSSTSSGATPPSGRAGSSTRWCPCRRGR